MLYSQRAPPSSKTDSGDKGTRTTKQDKQDGLEPRSLNAGKSLLPPPTSSSSLDQKQQEHPPQGPRSESAHQRQRDIEKERSRKVDQRHNVAYPPYPYPPYPSSYYSGFPGIHSGPPAPYPMHPAGPPPPHGGYPPQLQRGYGPPPHSGRGTKRSHAEREEGYGGRHDSYHAHWGGSYEDQHRPKRRWSNEEKEKTEEHPRILTKSDDKKSGRVSPDKKPASPAEITERSSFHRTLSSSSDTPTEASKLRVVTFADEPAVSEKDVAPAGGVNRRAPMQKIMLRKMGEKDGDSAAEKGKEAGPGNGRQPKASEQDTGAESAKPKTAWSMSDRGPIVSPKTLYEPEGKQSAAKFKKYQAQTREQQGSRGSHDLATPTSEGRSTPTGDKVERTKREDSSSPVDRAGQSSPSGSKDRRPSGDHRKGGRRPERAEPAPPTERDTHDHHNRPHHRKENSRREREGDHATRTERRERDGDHAARTTERQTSNEDECVREELEHSVDHQRGRVHPRREQRDGSGRPPLLGTA